MKCDLNINQPNKIVQIISGGFKMDNMNRYRMVLLPANRYSNNREGKWLISLTLSPAYMEGYNRSRF